MGRKEEICNADRMITGGFWCFFHFLFYIRYFVHNVMFIFVYEDDNDLIINCKVMFNYHKGCPRYEKLPFHLNEQASF